MRRLLAIGRRFVVIFAVLWVALMIFLLAILDLPLLLALPVSTAVAGGLAWFALDLAMLPEELEEDARADLENRSRRRFLDEVDRQGPGPRPDDRADG